jgi:hypothetical protein
VSYVGTDVTDTSKMYRRIYFNGKQIRGYNSEAIGTAYEDYHNVDHLDNDTINWTAAKAATMTRGLSFGMRAIKATSGQMPDGTKVSRYNDAHACGLDDVVIYNEVKDNDWVRSVYDGGTGYNHADSGGSGLVAYWRFNEGSGTTVKDLGPYGWHGTLTNAGVGEISRNEEGAYHDGENILFGDIKVGTANRPIASGVPTWEEIRSYE